MEEAFYRVIMIFFQWKMILTKLENQKMKQMMKKWNLKSLPSKKILNNLRFKPKNKF